MDALNRILLQHGALVRVAWIALALLLAACNNNPDSGGGNPGY